MYKYRFSRIVFMEIERTCTELYLTNLLPVCEV
jgi:hypothetical protein